MVKSAGTDAPVPAYRASHRFARISPQKVGLIADLVRGKYAGEAMEILQYQPQRAARILEKVIKSAMANAEDRRDPRPDYLVLEEVRVDRGPMFRRLRPKARGMATLIKKRMSHITVVLSSRD